MGFVIEKVYGLQAESEALLEQGRKKNGHLWATFSTLVKQGQRQRHQSRSHDGVEKGKETATTSSGEEEKDASVLSSLLRTHAVLVYDTFQNPALKSFSPDSTEEELPSSDVIESMIQALRSSRGKIEHYIQSLQSASSSSSSSSSSVLGELEQRQLTSVNLAELWVVTKLVILLYGIMLNQLIQDATKFGSDVYYWLDYESSAYKSSYYFVSTLPSRIFTISSRLQISNTTTTAATSASTSSSSTSATATPSTTTFPSAYASISKYARPLSLFPSWLMQRSQHILATPSTTSIISLVRKEMRHKRRRLVKLRQFMAACLGFLATTGIGLKHVSSTRRANSSSSDPVQDYLSKSQSDLSISSGALSDEFGNSGSTGDLVVIGSRTKGKGKQTQRVEEEGEEIEVEVDMEGEVIEQDSLTDYTTAQDAYLSKSISETVSVMDAMMRRIKLIVEALDEEEANKAVEEAMAEQGNGNSSNASRQRNPSYSSPRRRERSSSVEDGHASSKKSKRGLAALMEFNPETLFPRQPTTAVESVDIKSLYENVSSLLSHLNTYSSSMKHVNGMYGRPSTLTRYWLPTSILVLFGYKAASSVVKNQEAIRKMVRDVSETVAQFWGDWIIEPAVRIYKTIRHDDTESLRLMGAGSLESDLNSLERMVVDFAKDHGHLNDTEIANLISKTNQGDLTLVLEAYEREIKTPFKSAVGGELVRLLLIQVQKAKVDLELSLSAMDKLLRSNELNFAFLALIPTIFVVYGGVNWVGHVVTRRRGLGIQRGRAVIRSSLREVDKILTRHLHVAPVSSTSTSSSSSPSTLPMMGATGQQQRQLLLGNTLPPTALGNLLCEVALLRKYISLMPSSVLVGSSGTSRLLGGRKVAVNKLLEDLRDLEDGKMSVSQKIRVWERIWRDLDN